MATTGATGSTRVDTPRANGIRGRIAERNHETKAAFKTTEFWAMVGLIAAILIASAVSDSLDDVRAWTLVAAVGIGYMLSRGLAKSGSHHREGSDTI